MADIKQDLLLVGIAGGTIGSAIGASLAALRRRPVTANAAWFGIQGAAYAVCFFGVRHYAQKRAQLHPLASSAVGGGWCGALVGGVVGNTLPAIARGGAVGSACGLGLHALVNLADEWRVRFALEQRDSRSLRDMLPDIELPEWLPIQRADRDTEEVRLGRRVKQLYEELGALEDRERELLAARASATTAPASGPAH
eukprot:m.234740 g.234740  ORF g.234740 m.234740 type:complete len:197 (+) comp12709_c0_seq1:13-603(+)